jgi:hypothetical protein
MLVCVGSGFSRICQPVTRFCQDFQLVSEPAVIRLKADPTLGFETASGWHSGVLAREPRRWESRHFGTGRKCNGAAPRLYTMTVRLNSMTTTPFSVKPVVLNRTIPAFGREADSRFSSTSLRE